MRHTTYATITALLMTSTTVSQASGKIDIVAAENVYSDMARQIGGDDVNVTSILNSPEQDPHLFEASPSVARELHDARVVIYNGVGYDPWMDNLLKASRSKARAILVAADLAGAHPGDNPHLWYDPRTLPALANALTTTLSAEDPAHRATYEQRLTQFLDSLAPVTAKVTELRKRFSGTPVAATEPVFGYMFRALGMKVTNPGFQLAVMNETEPAASDIAAFESDLKQHRVRLMIYNSQASDPLADRMVKLAQSSKVPVVSVTETRPKGVDYPSWVLSELTAIERALSESDQ